MLLQPDSILVSQPLLLDIKQRRFLTGIRFAAESAELFHTQLRGALEVWNGLSTSASKHDEHLRIFASAWALVDNARRFHRLLWKLPSLKDLPCVRQFVDRWSRTLRKARNAMQHPDGDYSRDMHDNYVYGSVYWIDSRSRESEGIVLAHAVNAGPQANRELRDGIFPIDIPIDSGNDVHSVVLSTAGASVELDNLMRDIRDTLSQLEECVRERVEAYQAAPSNDAHRKARLALRAQADTYFRLEVRPGEAKYTKA
jgi:hypothetical protein